jgi:hypothetical protein
MNHKLIIYIMNPFNLGELGEGEGPNLGTPNLEGTQFRNS